MTPSPSSRSSKLRLVLACLLVVAGAFILSGAASGSSARARLTAHLTSKSFTAAKAGKVKLVCKLTAPSKHFAYAITRKSGKKWLTVKSVKKTGTFKGSCTTTVKKLFAGKQVKVGSYKLKLTVDTGSKTLPFTVKKPATTITTPTGSAPVNISAPTISGTARDGQTLTAADGSWSGSPAPALSRQWLRCDAAGANCSPISGATASTYALVNADDHSTIRVRVTGTNASGSASAQSNQTLPVAAIAKSISSGYYDSCAVLSDGTVECWGMNGYGQLGDGSTTDSATPVRVSGIANAVQVSVGSDYSCALLSDKTVWCWGSGTDGRLGHGDFSTSHVPVQVYSSGTTPLANVTEVSAGDYHACALIADGTIDCWGYGHYGQLGHGGSLPGGSSAYPVQVYSSGTTPLSGALALTSGGEHSCALMSGGAVECWGSGSSGELGNGVSSSSSYPVQVQAVGGGGSLSGAVQLSAHGNHTCAVFGSGRAACWGYGIYGQLGDGNKSSSSFPVQVNSSGTTPLESVSQVGAGGRHTCAVLAGGTVDCWGDGYYGELGHGDRDDSAYPVQVFSSGTTPLANVSRVSASDEFSCALDSGGAVACWGDNSNDQLGGGKIGHLSNPLQINSGGTALANATQVVTGATFSCALRSDSSVWCWGENANGQLGNGSFNDSYEPVRVEGVDGSGFLTAVELSAGRDHVCARLGGGTAACWGKNDTGQLGHGSWVDSSVPIQVYSSGSTPLPDVAHLSAGGDHTCALRSGGTLACWGWNYYGQLGHGGSVPGANQAYPVEVYDPSGVMPLENVIQVSGGVFHTCAVISGGTVECWGNGYYGQLGDGAFSDPGVSLPVTASGISASSVSAGATHTCALLAAGAVDCWGSNWSGELGHGTSSAPVASPVEVYSSDATAITGVTQVSAGYDYTCALLSGDSVDCWGSNWTGQLGTGNLSEAFYPTATNLLAAASGVSAGSGVEYQHTCALTTTGNVWCWGSDSNGQLGLPGLGLSLYSLGVLGLSW